jgi:hypothetical protein
MDMAWEDTGAATTVLVLYLSMLETGSAETMAVAITTSIEKGICNDKPRLASRKHEDS